MYYKIMEWDDNDGPAKLAFKCAKVHNNFGWVKRVKCIFLELDLDI